MCKGDPVAPAAGSELERGNLHFTGLIKGHQTLIVTLHFSTKC